MEEVVPGNSKELFVQVDQAVDLDGLALSTTKWIRPVRTSERHDPAIPSIMIFVNWEKTSNHCSREASENARKTFQALDALDSRLSQVEITGHLAYKIEHVGCSHLLNFLAEANPFRLLTINFKIDDGNHHSEHIFDAFASNKITANTNFTATKSSYFYYSFRLVPIGSRGVTERDYILFHKLAESWATKNNNEDVVFNAHNFNFLQKMEEARSYNKNLIVPYLGSQNDLEYPAAAALLCEAATKFDAVEVDTQIWNQLSEIDVITCTTNTSERAPLKLTLYHVANNEALLVPPTNYKEVSSSSIPSTRINGTSALLQHPKYSNNNSFRGCYIRCGNLPDPDDIVMVHSLVNQSINECSAFPDKFSYVLWEFDLGESDFNKSVADHQYYASTLMPKLQVISSQTGAFLQRYPGTQIALKLVVAHPYVNTGMCDGLHSKYRQFPVVLMGWAYVNNVTLFLNTNSDAGFADSLLRNAQKVMPKLHDVAMKWPQYVTRNVPSNLNGFYPWEQDQCVSKPNSEKYSNSKTFNVHPGATLNMTLGGKPLSNREVQTQLQGSFHRFSSLEIVLGGRAEGNALLEALSSEFLEFLEADESKTVYIRVPSIQLLHEEDLKLVLNSVSTSLKVVQHIRLGGVHVYSPPDITDMNRVIQQLKGIVSMDDIQVGLFLRPCERFLATLLNGPSTSNQLSPEIDYVVCSITTPQTEHYSYKKQYDDAHLYISRVIKSRFSNLTLYFKHTPESAPQNNPQELQATFFQKWSTGLMFGSMGAIFLVTVISLTVWICLLRGRVRYLSKQEIYEFRNGVPLEPGIELDMYSTLKYNSSYEISKGELNLDSATLLGMGNFGQVRKTSVKGNLAAIKSPHDSCSKESFKSMLIEVKVMCHLGAHPNLVELVGCHTSEIGRGMIYIVTALCENGSLLSCLKNRDVVVQFQDMVKFAHDIACGMDYIAGKNVVHGDLATRNVLLDSHNICKIGDFGLSRKLYEYSIYVKQSQEPLPWRWMAYESLFRMEFTSMSDVWSYGVTLWEIFSLGAVPYPGLQWTMDFVEELKTGLRMNTPEFATPEIYNMMLTCWNLDPKSRPTFEELVKFFIPFRDAEYENLGD